MNNKEIAAKCNHVQQVVQSLFDVLIVDEHLAKFQDRLNFLIEDIKTNLKEGEGCQDNSFLTRLTPSHDIVMVLPAAQKEALRHEEIVFYSFKENVINQALKVFLKYEVYGMWTEGLDDPETTQSAKIGFNPIIYPYFRTIDLIKETIESSGFTVEVINAENYRR